jgi:hypothetical protein
LVLTTATVRKYTLCDPFFRIQNSTAWTRSISMVLVSVDPSLGGVKSYQAHRFSPLAQITPQNVARLRPAWVYQIEGRGRFESSPLVVDGIMYVTEPPTKVTALDARTGRRIWSWQKRMPKELVLP